MRAPTASRAQMKAPRRTQQPITLQIAAPNPVNPVAKAMAQRRLSGAAGKHRRSPGAQRRADRMALQRMAAE